MIICHLTSVHKPYDVRIFLKECRSLASAGHQVHLVVPSEKTGTEVKDGVTIHFVKKPTGRKERFLQTGKLVVEVGLKTEATVFHLHDPELLVWVGKLKNLNKKVIYDAHEDLPRQIAGKPWIAKPIRKFVGTVSEMGENRYAKKVDAIVTATPHIAERFIKINPNTININNYPLLEEFPVGQEKKPAAKPYVIYVGGIMRSRGAVEMIKALEWVDVKLLLAGTFESDALLEECKQLPGWKNVEYVGFVGRGEVSRLILGALAGLVVLHPLDSYKQALPIKMFEYAAAGVPVIASNFPFWEKLINAHQFGLTVSPTNPQEIAKAIAELLGNPTLAARLGANGKVAVENHFNWKTEEHKLLDLYNKLA
ncbi:MAG: glycosyltransferase [Sphingobacteriales bacterium JAD_PAG50586_3]|nr:MAG: glycosyltransferase [Sphingobacteriales bacterium JAD_PAG50586_3]